MNVQIITFFKHAFDGSSRQKQPQFSETFPGQALFLF